MSSPQGQLSSDEQLKKAMDEATVIVKQQGFAMKRALDQNNLREGLKHASNMLCELRSSVLTPKMYYELYMTTIDELRHLEHFFYQEWKNGSKVVDFYEMVQHAGNIVPRLYLLITVGSVYIKSKEAAAKEILRDLVEMCRGVQHPIRGLFLRNYLLQLGRDKLPDVGSEYGDAVEASVDFLMQNFGEMNKLWVRMQHQGPVRDREKREKERNDLRILVGMNLTRLSQLEGVDVEMYSTTVLPQLLEQVLNCKDKIAQQYLLESIIAVFPDEFHLRTLEQMLESLTHLQSGVDVRAILVSLMDRLAAFAKDNASAIPQDISIFDLFHAYVTKLTQAENSSMSIAELLGLQVALVRFALNFAPDRLDYVDSILSVCADSLKANIKDKVTERNAVQAIVDLLSVPMQAYSNVLTVLELSNYASLLSYLEYEPRKRVALNTVRGVLKTKTDISDFNHVDRLLTFISPLVKDEADQPSEDDVDKEELAEEQQMVASIVHLIYSDDTDMHYKMFSTARRHFGQGGPSRIKFTLVPLIFRTLELVRRIKAAQDAGNEVTMKADKLLRKFCSETVAALGSNEASIAMKLFLQCALTADECGFGELAYDLFSQACILYEDEVSDSKVQMQMNGVFVNTLSSMKNLGDENYDTLATKTTQYGAKLLKKPDQCKAVYRCSHLFWNAEAKFFDHKRVLDCLQRSLKIADACNQSGPHVGLFVEILEHYVFYFEAGNEKVQMKYLQGLVDLITENLQNGEGGPEEAVAKAHFKKVIAAVKAKAAQDADKWSALTFP